MTFAPPAVARWAVHPQPLPDETVTSWLVRVARANGSSLSSWLAAEHGVPAWRHEQNLDTADVPERWSRLAARGAVRGGGAALRAMSFCGLPPRVSSWLLTDGRAAKERRARWCPRCLATDADPYFRRTWRWEWVAWCPRDGTRLRDACPACAGVLDYTRVPWDRPLAACRACRADLTPVLPDVAGAPAFVGATVAAALDGLAALTADDIDALWSLQRFVRLVGWRRDRGLFVPPFADDAGDLPTFPAMSPEAIATAFALGWHLLTTRRADLPWLAQQHQGSFNQAIVYRCPPWLRAFHRPVQPRPEPLTGTSITAAVARLRAEGRPIHYASVAAELGRDCHAIIDEPRWRALVDAAAPPAVGPRTRRGRPKRRGRHRVQPQWVAAMAVRVAAGRAQLKARDARPSRAAIAREIGVTEDVLKRFERATGRPLTVLTAERRRARVRLAVAGLRSRGARISTLGVARELGWDRNVIEHRPELKAIVRAARAPRLTVEDVARATDDLATRGERVTTLGVSRELGRERDQIERSTDLKAVVKAAQARQREALAAQVGAAVADLRRRDEPVTFRAVAAALGKDEHFFERHTTLREIVLTAKAS